MIRRNFDANGDITANNYIEQSPASIQAVSTRLKMFFGEWFLDVLDGTKYFENIFIKPVNLSLAEATLKERILQTEGVATLETFSASYDPDSRDFNVEFSATTEYGDTFTQNDVIGLNPLGV